MVNAWFSYGENFNQSIDSFASSSLNSFIRISKSFALSVPRPRYCTSLYFISDKWLAFIILARLIISLPGCLDSILSLPRLMSCWDIFSVSPSATPTYWKTLWSSMDACSCKPWRSFATFAWCSFFFFSSSYFLIYSCVNVGSFLASTWTPAPFFLTGLALLLTLSAAGSSILTFMGG